MKLLSMRDLNVQDPLPGLGEKVEPPAKPVVPIPEPTATPGVYHMPDGKLVTDIPENERANWRPVIFGIDWASARSLYRELSEQNPKSMFEQEYMLVPYNVSDEGRAFSNWLRYNDRGNWLS